jgi:hypothetical protein
MNGLFGGISRLHHQGQTVMQARNQHLLAFLFELKMEATYSSEASVDFQRTTRRYIPEDRTLHDHRCKNITFYLELDFSKNYTQTIQYDIL